MESILFERRKGPLQIIDRKFCMRGFFTEPDHDISRSLVYREHVADLRRTLGQTELMNGYCIDPKIALGRDVSITL